MIVVFMLIAAAFGFCIYMLVKTLSAPSPQKTAIPRGQKPYSQFFTKHTYGLPIAEGVQCVIRDYFDHIDFVSGNIVVTLSSAQVIDMCVKTETEIQNQYVSSIGRAVGGAVLFGPLGAMIGGRAKKKTSKTTNYYLIVTYKNAENVVSYLGFDVTASYWQAVSMINVFKQSNPGCNTQRHINL